MAVQVQVWRPFWLRLLSSCRQRVATPSRNCTRAWLLVGTAWYLMHPPAQLLLDRLEFRPHAVAPGLPFDQEAAPAGCSADEGEAQEVEGFRFAEPLLPAVCRRMASELDQPGLLGVKRQRELPYPLAQQVQEAPSVGLVLETDDEVVGIAHDDHVARSLAPSPALGEQVEHVEQVDIGEQRRDGSSNAKDNLRCLPVRRLCGRSRDHRHRLICLAKECSATDQ